MGECPVQTAAALAHEPSQHRGHLRHRGEAVRQAAPGRASKKEGAKTYALLMLHCEDVKSYGLARMVRWFWHWA